MKVIRYPRYIRLKGLCDHCGNVTFQDVIDERTRDEFSATYIYCQCSICDEVTLRRLNYDWRAYEKLVDEAAAEYLPEEMDLDEIEPETLWPPALSLPPEAPERVRAIYEEARRVRRQSPSSFAVQIGRAMEAVASDKNAEGHTLNQKLRWLVDKRDLPDVFGRMLHANRIFRNWGAHDAATDVEAEDVEIIDQFFRAFIEYLYVAPAKVQQVEKLISDRKQEV